MGGRSENLTCEKNSASQKLEYNAARTPNRTIKEAYFVAIVMVLFLILSFWKMRGFLLEGRFWAEEGVHFYTDISRHDNIWGALGYLFHGHLEIMTNFIVLLSTKVDLQYAPLVTTYGSLVLQLIPVVFVVGSYQSLGLSRLNVALFVITLVGLAQSAEVWANSINLHFHFAVLAAVMLVIEPKTMTQKWGSCILVAVSGLSGIPANFLVPIFLLKAFFEKSKISWIHALILTATALLQIALLFANQLEMGARQLTLPPLITWYAIIAQMIWSPLAGFQIFKDAIFMMHGGITGETWTLLRSLIIAAFGTGLIGYIFISAFRRKHSVILLLIGSSLSLALMSVFTALGEKLGLVSEFGAGRYFFASNFLGCLAFFVLASQRQNWMIRIFSLILVLSSFSRVRHMFEGPSWSISLKEAIESNSSEIKIWPHGWQMANPMHKAQNADKP